MAKPTERQLFSVYLDIEYSDEILQETINELTDQLKEFKLRKKKTAKLLVKVKEDYEKVYGRLPTRNKKDL